MKVAVFSTKPYDKLFLQKVNENYKHELIFYEARLNTETCEIALKYEAICVFVNDILNKKVLQQLAEGNTKLIALRCAGFNNVDLEAAEKLGFTIVRVPAYSPHAVAEHTVAMMLTVNRKIHKSYTRVREGNFSLDGLLGFDMNGKTVGVIGTGKIGLLVAKVLKGFGCKILAYDLYPNQEGKDLGIEYITLEKLFEKSDIITLHCPLTPDNYHFINKKSISLMKDNVMIINTGRGALVHTTDVIHALKSGKIGYLGLDVYEEEGDVFFEDLSGKVIQDDTLARLLTFPNVLITSHQAFFTQNALDSIADTTLSNISDFENGKDCANVVKFEKFVKK